MRMKKQTKRARRKKVALVPFTAAVFLLAGILRISSILILGTINNNIAAQTQEVAAQIDELRTQNDAVKVVIQTLSSKDRVDTLASDSGLAMNQENIVTITAATDGE